MAEVKKKENKSHQKNEERFVQMSITARWHVLEDFFFFFFWTAVAVLQHKRTNSSSLLSYADNAH